MISPSLILVVAQRLIRRLCPDCKEAYEPTPEELGAVKVKADLLFRPKGCAKCNQIGYRGRIAIGEVLLVNESIRELINQRASFIKIRDVAKAEGMQTLFDSAIKKVEAGVTSFEEALSVTIGVG
jgi:type II secretory ATPase GspE/PulE/Tfp pilus assembly ATPase PilB-like protein